MKKVIALLTGDELHILGRGISGTQVLVVTCAKAGLGTSGQKSIAADGIDNLIPAEDVIWARRLMTHKDSLDEEDKEIPFSKT